MTISELKNHLTNLIGHVVFVYNGYSCGIEPLSLNKFDMWYGNDSITVDSIEKVMNEPLFNGKSLKDIWDDIANLDF